MAKIKTAIGLMSGTSMDGIDVALIKTDGISHLEFGPTGEFAYDALFAQRLNDALVTAQAVEERLDRPGNLKALEAEITDRHQGAVQLFLDENGLTPNDIDIVGFHGQTVIHRPDLGFTVQLGDGQALADQIGMPVMWDMRANDMKNGGQGAPLAPAFHNALAKTSFDRKTRAFVNIGGIANVTFTSPKHEPIAFDCGPGNALIDQWVRTKTNLPFDNGGALALAGQADEEVLAEYLVDSFFEENTPKSLDRNDFSLAPMRITDAADGAATLAEFTARAIARSREFAIDPPDIWIVSGGGRRNLAMMNALKRLLPDAAVLGADEAGFHSDAMEAQCWAYLAVRAKRGFP
ncbi:MAG: anhydro-N-acetylmuramic acid kinase, partial [Pseudomonadota bacterium]